MLLAPPAASAQDKELMVRMAEIEVDSTSLATYLSMLKEEAAASVKLEKGVIAIFPMFTKAHPTQIRILEIYANKEAYEAHLKSPHFLKYKSSTLKMVKSLKLSDMSYIDRSTMTRIFKKLESGDQPTLP